MASEFVFSIIILLIIVIISVGYNFYRRIFTNKIQLPPDHPSNTFASQNYPYMYNGTPITTTAIPGVVVIPYSTHQLQTFQTPSMQSSNTSSQGVSAESTADQSLSAPYSEPLPLYTEIDTLPPYKDNN